MYKLFEHFHELLYTQQQQKEKIERKKKRKKEKQKQKAACSINLLSPLLASRELTTMILFARKYHQQQQQSLDPHRHLLQLISTFPAVW